MNNDQVYREIIVTDREGRLVAASSATSDYIQSDETWWKEAFNDGTRGLVSVSDVLWDESTKSHAIEIAVPVTERPGERLVGVLKVVADARELLAVAAGVKSSTSGEAFLIREDGTIVFSQRGVGGQAQFFAADLFRERMKSYKAGDPQFRIDFSARDQGGRSYLVGVAPCQLGASYPHLAWLVAVTQAEDDLFAPARAQMWRLLAVFGLIAVFVLAIAVWFSLRLAAPAVGKDTHITEHPEVPRIEQDALAAVRRPLSPRLSRRCGAGHVRKSVSRQALRFPLPRFPSSVTTPHRRTSVCPLPCRLLRSRLKPRPPQPRVPSPEPLSVPVPFPWRLPFDSANVACRGPMISRRDVLKGAAAAGVWAAGRARAEAWQQAAAQAPAGESLGQYVDPFIGTGGHGHTFPGASMPGGLVQLSPDSGQAGVGLVRGLSLLRHGDCRLQPHAPERHRDRGSVRHPRHADAGGRGDAARPSRRRSRTRRRKRRRATTRSICRRSTSARS